MALSGNIESKKRNMEGNVPGKVVVHRDGFSPIVDIEKIAGGHSVTITDEEGQETFNVMDGFSPSVKVERTENGVLISITDKDGSTTAEVKDGKDGEGGSGGNVDLTGYATEQYVQEYAQPKGDYLTEHQSLDGYAKTKDIPTKPEDIGAQPVGNYLTEVPSGYATEEWVRDGYQPKGKYLTEVPEGYAKTTDIPTKPGDIGAQPAGNYALKSEIPSVPVQSVNGKTGAVKLSADDVGARPSSWMPTAQDVGALPSTYTPPNQTAEQVGADPKGTAATAVSQHNTAGDAHGDIRLALQAINDRLTAFFDSDDQTLDELSEIVAYITSNKSLIDAITTSKVSVLDIVNNLTTNVANKPLSAAQGAVLKGMIDAVSTSLSGYQPKGEYALKSEIPNISGKLDASKLPEAINTALAQAKTSGEFDGEDGTSVTVKSVSESTADGGSNVVTFSDGKTVTIKNGSKGSKGDKPAKGTDYWTDADQEAIVQQVITALGTPVFGRVDADNNIILTGDLVEGSYALKYENADGEVIDIGMLNMAEQLINYITTSINADGTQYLGTNGEKGYKVGYRLSSSGGESTEANLAITGFMPVKANYTIYFKNTAIKMGSNDHSYGRVVVYDGSFTQIANGASLNMSNNLTTSYTTDEDGYLNSLTLDSKVKNLANAAYIRVSYHYLTQHGGTGNAGDAFISINKPID